MKNGQFGSLELICPDCRRMVTPSSIGYFCETCTRSFEMVRGVYRFLPSNLDAFKLMEDEARKIYPEHLFIPYMAILHKADDIKTFLETVIPHYRFEGMILEVGAGICWASSMIKERYPQCQVYASDVSPYILEKGSLVGNMIGRPPDYLFACDVENLPFPDNYFDQIFGSAILHHLSPPIKGLQEIHRVLKPGGSYLGIGEIAVSGFFKTFYRRFMGPKRREERHEIRENTYSYSEWKHFLQKGGFKSYRIILYKDHRHRISLLRMLYYYFLERLPDALIKRLLASSIHIEAVKENFERA